MYRSANSLEVDESQIHVGAHQLYVDPVPYVKVLITLNRPAFDGTEPSPEAIGWVVLFVALGITIAVGVAVLPLALLAIGVFALVWNLATAALLPVVVADRRPFGESVREGIRASWQGKGRWWLAVVAQMVLLGWVTFLSVSYTSNPRPGSFSTQNKTDFSVNAFWTGGYENECRWHSKLMAVVETKPLPLTDFLLGVLFAVLAVIVKLEVADHRALGRSRVVDAFGQVRRRANGNGR